MKPGSRACPLCGDLASDTVLELVQAPLEDALQAKAAVAKDLARTPVDLDRCGVCSHVFLSVVPQPDTSYSNYQFQSSKSPGLVGLMGDVSERVWVSAKGQRGDLVLDIGSHDGALLALFKDLGSEVLRVEPSSRQAVAATERGLPTINGYFSSKVVKDVLAGRVPKIVCLHYVLANIESPVDFIREVAEVIENDTLVSLVTGYHPDQFLAGMFDWIYHEHLSYFCAADVQALARASGLVIKSVSRIPYKGGSLHVILEKAVAGAQDVDALASLSAWERWAGVNLDSSFGRLQNLILENTFDAASQVSDLLKQYKLVGYGSSHSTTTLILNLRLGDSLSWLVDDNTNRHGLFSPGTGLQIRPPESVLESDIVVVILAWQHDWRIAARLKELGYKGQVLRVMPRVELLEIGEI